MAEPDVPADSHHWNPPHLQSLHRPKPALPVWQLRAPALSLRRRQTEEAKVALLRELRATATKIFLVESEDPIANGVAGQWQRVGPETWLVPADADPRALVGWLSSGGWFLYATDHPIQTDDLDSMGFSPKAEDLTALVNRLRLAFLVVSFHDDILWTIALGARE